MASVKAYLAAGAVAGLLAGALLAVDGGGHSRA
jgi:hypothetical protein